MNARNPAKSRLRSDKTASDATAPEFFSLQTTRARRFYLDLDPPRSQRLTVVCGGIEHCESDYRIRRSNFRYYSVEFVAGGEGSIRFRGNEQPLGAGSVFAYGPGIPHDIRCDPARPLVKCFVDFVGRAAPDLMPLPGNLVRTSAPQRVLRLFEDLITAGQGNTPFSARLCACVLEQLLLTISETAVEPAVIGSAAFETYQRCRQYVDDHFLILRGLDELAGQCHIDSAYICRLFKRFDHQSPHQYLVRLKMLEAGRRLQVPGALVKQVSTELGFTDPFQFSRTFRRVIGMSPRSFSRFKVRDQ
jgi:AraC-like DNA-binding protein